MRTLAWIGMGLVFGVGVAHAEAIDRQFDVGSIGSTSVNIKEPPRERAAGAVVDNPVIAKRQGAIFKNPKLIAPDATVVIEVSQAEFMKLIDAREGEETSKSKQALGEKVLKAISNGDSDVPKEKPKSGMIRLQFLGAEVSALGGEDVLLDTLRVLKKAAARASFRNVVLTDSALSEQEAGCRARDELQAQVGLAGMGTANVQLCGKGSPSAWLEKPGNDLLGDLVEQLRYLNRGGSSSLKRSPYYSEFMKIRRPLGEMEQWDDWANQSVNDGWRLHKKRLILDDRSAIPNDRSPASSGNADEAGGGSSNGGKPRLDLNE